MKIKYALSFVFVGLRGYWLPPLVTLSIVTAIVLVTR